LAPCFAPKPLALFSTHEIKLDDMNSINKFALRSIIPAGVALMSCASAHAQSSITLYGLIDAGVDYVSHAANSNGTSGAAWRFGNAVSGNRWGFKGNEDLGDGLAAIFQLEGGFNIGTGAAAQGGREFGRTAIVGLSSTRWGTLKLGRQYDPLVDMVSALTEDAYFGLTFGTPGDVDNYDGSMRVNNSVKYLSPNVGGVQFEALYGFGGVAGSTGAGQTWSIAGSYASGPLALAAGYYYASGGDTLGSTGVRTWSASADSPFNTAVNAGFATAHSVSIARAAGQYTYGAWVAGLGYSHTEYAPDGASLFTSSARFNSGSAFVNYQMDPALRLGVGYHYTWLSGAESAHYHQVNAAADYALSKRTDLYAVAAFQRASGSTLDASGASVAAQAVIGDYGLNSGSKTQTLVAIGMRQRF
jgi:predicted porin